MAGPKRSPSGNNRRSSATAPVLHWQEKHGEIVAEEASCGRRSSSRWAWRPWWGRQTST